MGKHKNDRCYSNGHDDDCCDDLLIRHQYVRYHRFFIFSPLFLLFALGTVFFASRGEVPPESYKLLIMLVLLVTFKEVAGVFVSRRIYNRVLKPVEDLKKGFYEVSKGNYGVEVPLGYEPEISELVKAFNQMSQQLRTSEIEKQKYEENRKALVASISHDLKTPITSINGFVEGILEGVANTPEKQVSYMRVIQDNARYMNRLIDDLLLYSKLDLNQLNFEFKQINIGDYVTELFEELVFEHEEKGVAMVFDNSLTSEEAAETTLWIDPKEMTRAIRNIVGNAVMHSGTETLEICFKLQKEADAVTLKILDNGRGIPKDQLGQIFQRFFRGDASRSSASGGSGLGLAIAQEIVEAHSGKIWATSEGGKGTEIGICLPLSQEEGLCLNRKS